MFKPLKNIALSVNLATRFTVAPGAHVTSGGFRSHRRGRTALGGARRAGALHVRQLHLNGDYDGVKNHLALNQAVARCPRRHHAAQGRRGFPLRPGRAGQHQRRADFLAHRARTCRASSPNRSAFRRCSSRATIRSPARTVRHQARQPDRAGLRACPSSGSIALGAEGQAPGLALNGKLAAAAGARRLLHYWPLPVAERRARLDRCQYFRGLAGAADFRDAISRPGMLDQDDLAGRCPEAHFPDERAWRAITSTASPM